MAIVHHVAQVAATLAAIVQTRLALAAVEMEEESLRFLSYLALATLLGVRASFRSKPKLLSFTMSELNKDLDELQHLARRGSEQP